MPNAHALVVGIADYAFAPTLPATRDADDMAELLADPAFCGYPARNVVHLADAGATGAAIRRALTDLAAQANTKSTVVIFFSGHGGRVDSGPHAGEYLVPVDGDPASDATIGRRVRRPPSCAQHAAAGDAGSPASLRQPTIST